MYFFPMDCIVCGQVDVSIMPLADLKLPLNETLTLLYGILTDSNMLYLQPLTIDAISSLLWHLPLETQSLEIISISSKCLE